MKLSFHNCQVLWETFSNFNMKKKLRLQHAFHQTYRESKTQNKFSNKTQSKPLLRKKEQRCMSSSFFYVTTYWRKDFYQSKCRSTLQIVSSNFIVDIGDRLLFRPLYPEIHVLSLPNQSSRDLRKVSPQVQAPSYLRPVEHQSHLNLERWVPRFQAGGPYPVSPSFWKHISHGNLIQ